MKQIRKLYGLLLTCSLICSGAGVRAQAQHGRNDVPLFNSPEGPVLLFGGSSIDASGTDYKGLHFSLSRSAAADAPARPMALNGMVKSLQAFRHMVGQPFTTQLRQQLKLSSDEALWSYLRQHRELSAYGLASFNIPFRVAMGAAFVDGDIKGQKGKTFVYLLTIDAPGQPPHTARSEITIGANPDFPAPHILLTRTRDSLVTIQWKVRLQRDIPYLGMIYRQSGDRGAFTALPARVLAKTRNDSATFLFTDKVNGNSAYRYFMRPADLLGNPGEFNSDTASIVAANFNRLPHLTQLKARDTLNGILVSWKPLPIDPLVTGIEIQRSRDSRGDFVAIDTISPMAHTYMDKKLLPHIAYYYRLCVLHAGSQTQKEKFYSPVSADQQKTSRVPDAPYGVTAKTDNSGVTIYWHPVSDPDFYAYFVYRGTSQSAPMQVISPALTDTAFADTASNLSGRLSYVYAVKAVTNSNKASGFSAKVAARLPKGKDRPLTPGGIRLSPRPGAVYIEWDDTRKNDPSVIGYILYKHLSSGQPLKYDVSKSGSAEALRLGLTLAVNGVITVPFYTDTLATGGVKYEYLVAAVDRYNMISGLSPVASAQRLNDPSKHPPAKIFVRTTPEGIAIQWEQADPAGVEGYIIYRRTVGRERSSKRIARVNGSLNQYTDKQPVKGNLYAYSITTVTEGGETTPSDERSVRK